MFAAFSLNMNLVYFSLCESSTDFIILECSMHGDWEIVINALDDLALAPARCILPDKICPMVQELSDCISLLYRKKLPSVSIKLLKLHGKGGHRQ